jgi:hypothetical protein
MASAERARVDGQAVGAKLLFTNQYNESELHFGKSASDPGSALGYAVVQFIRAIFSFEVGFTICLSFCPAPSLSHSTNTKK